MISSAQWATALIQQLAAAGIRDVIISPGSRSTPLAAAALAHRQLDCRSIIDERSAAFFALGQARVSGKPSAVIATSGSAAAHYWPAVVEAAHAHIPLVIVTADRPAQLHGCEAPQTMEQGRLYGAFARAAFDLGDPTASGLAALSRKTAQAVLASLFPDPGPVHLNVALGKPLEPEPRATDPAVPGPHLPVPRMLANSEGVTVAAQALAQARSGVISCGTMLGPAAADPDRVAELAHITGFAVAPDAASQQRFRSRLTADRVWDTSDWLLESVTFRQSLSPDCIVSIGAPPLSPHWGFLPGRRTIVSAFGYPDPSSQASQVLLGHVDDTLVSLCEALRACSSDAFDRERTHHRHALAAASRRVWDLVEAELGAPTRLSEPGVVSLTVDRLSHTDLLVIGNSLPIREVNLYCRARSDGPQVVAQRGVNGIDGIVSGAAGAAQRSRKATTLLIGDVSFLHDLGGLASAAALEAPLTIVVIDNGGGRIFEQLPLARGVPARDMTFWTTPPGLDLAHAAAAFGLGFAEADSPRQLAAALSDAKGRAGATLVRARVEPQDAAMRRARILEAIA